MTPQSWKRALAFAVALLFVGGLSGPGCQPPAGDDDDDADDDNADDDTSGDLEYYDQDPDFAYQMGMYGFLQVSAERSSLGGSPAPVYYASAQFYEVLEAETLSLQGIEFDPAEGVEDCSLHWYNGSGLGNPGKVAWWSAAGVSVRSGEQEADLLEFTGGEVVGYDVDLAALGYEPRWSEGYGFEVLGAEAPSLDLDPALVLPEQLEVSQPDIASGAPLPRSDLLFQWSGSGPDPAVILIHGHETADTVPPFYELRCEVLDDGEFLVPGDLMQQLPAGGYAHVTVSREAVDILTNDEGLDIASFGWVADRSRVPLE